MNSDISIGQPRPLATQQVAGKTQQSTREGSVRSKPFSDLVKHQHGEKTDDGSKLVAETFQQSERSGKEKPSNVNEGEEKSALKWSETGQELSSATTSPKSRDTGERQPILMLNVQYSLQPESAEADIEDGTLTAIKDGDDLEPVAVAFSSGVEGRHDIASLVNAGGLVTPNRASGQPIAGDFVKVGVAALPAILTAREGPLEPNGKDTTERQSENERQSANTRRSKGDLLQGSELEKSLDKQKHVVTANDDLKTRQVRRSDLKLVDTDRAALLKPENDMKVRVLASSQERFSVPQSINVVWDRIGQEVVSNLKNDDRSGRMSASSIMEQTAPFAAKTKTVKYLNIQLKPRDLGIISIKLVLSSHDLDISLAGSDSGLIEKLKQNTNRLAKQIRAAGFSVDKLNISFADMDTPSSVRGPLPNTGFDVAQFSGRLGHDAGQLGGGRFQENSRANGLRAPDSNENEDERLDDANKVNVRKYLGADIYL